MTRQRHERPRHAARRNDGRDDGARHDPEGATRRREILVAGAVARLHFEDVLALREIGQRRARDRREGAPGGPVEPPGEGQIGRCRDRVASAEREDREGDGAVALGPSDEGRLWRGIVDDDETGHAGGFVSHEVGGLHGQRLRAVARRPRVPDGRGRDGRRRWNRSERGGQRLTGGPERHARHAAAVVARDGRHVHRAAHVNARRWSTEDHARRLIVVNDLGRRRGRGEAVAAVRGGVDMQPVEPVRTQRDVESEVAGGVGKARGRMGRVIDEDVDPRARFRRSDNGERRLSGDLRQRAERRRRRRPEAVQAT